MPVATKGKAVAVKGEVLPKITKPTEKDIEAVNVEALLTGTGVISSPAEAEALFAVVEQAAARMMLAVNRLYDGNGWRLMLDSEGVPFTNFGAMWKERTGQSHESGYRLVRGGEFVRELEKEHALNFKTDISGLNKKQIAELELMAKQDVALLKRTVAKLKDKGPKDKALSAAKMNASRLERNTAKIKRAENKEATETYASYKAALDYITGLTEQDFEAEITPALRVEYMGNAEGLKEHANLLRTASLTLANLATLSDAIDVLPAPDADATEATENAEAKNAEADTGTEKEENTGTE